MSEPNFDLPGRVSFVAYTKASVRAPGPDGTALTVRSQVWVRYYDSIKIAKVQVGGREGAKSDETPRTAYITFDPESAGLREAFGANMDASDPLLATLQEAEQTGEPLSIAIETVRRRKTKNTSEAISPTVPIHALRGAHRDGSGSNMSTSGNNVTNLVALVAGQPTKECHSDPAEWPGLVNNKDGALPPEGWRFVVADKDWDAFGVIVADNETSTTGATKPPAAPTGAAREAIEDVVTKVLHDQLPGLLDKQLRDAVGVVVGEVRKAANPAPVDGTDIDRPPPRAARAKEANPFTAFNTDGRVNLGGSLLSKTRDAVRWADEQLGGAAQEGGPAPSDDAVWDLAERLLCAADTVQTRAYGSGARPDRLAKSHFEATSWVKWVIATGLPLPATAPGDPEALRTWMQQAAAAAGDQYVRASAAAHAYFGVTAPQTDETAGTDTTAGDVQSPAGSGDNPEAEESQRHDPPQQSPIRAAVETLRTGWDDLTVLRALRDRVAHQQLMATPVAIRVTNNHPEIVPPEHATDDTWTHSTLGEQIDQRGWFLHHNSAETGSTPASASDSSAAGPTPAAYPPQVTALITTLRAAATVDAVTEAYRTASEAELLDTPIRVRETPDGFEFADRPDAAGFDQQTLSAVLRSMKIRIETPTTAQAAPAPPEQAPPAWDSAQQLVDQAEQASRGGDKQQLLDLQNQLEQNGWSEHPVSLKGRGGRGAAAKALTYLVTNVDRLQGDAA